MLLAKKIRFSLCYYKIPGLRCLGQPLPPKGCVSSRAPPRLPQRSSEPAKPCTTCSWHTTAAAAGLCGCAPASQVEDHLSEGLRFYMSLQDAVKQHQQQCSDYAYTRALQRDDLQQVGLREGS